MSAVVESCHARVGLLGNPSDIYGGRCLALSLKQFEARVTLTPNEGAGDPAIYILPGGSEPVRFDHAADGDEIGDGCPTTTTTTAATPPNPAVAAAAAGEDGGRVLLTSMVSVLRRYCALVHIDLARLGRPSDGRGFTLRYETNVPFQLGLSGSSAILCAGLRCLVRYYGLRDRLPKALLPNLVLKAEKDLGTVAGYMDRVIQVYGGLVYMDFNRHLFEDFGHGAYDNLDPAILPDLYLMFAADWGEKKEAGEHAAGAGRSDNGANGGAEGEGEGTGTGDGSENHSGKIHSNVRQRWLAGDAEVVAAMKQFADIAARGRRLLVAERREETFPGDFAALISENFRLRRKIFGDRALGKANLDMVALAEAHGAAAKFTGSGGALVVFCPGGRAQADAAMAAAHAAGYAFMKIDVAAPSNW